MATKLSGHLDALDETRVFFSAQKRVGIRRYIAQKANVDVSDVIKLEIYGLNGCEPHKADKIFDALAQARGSLVDHSEKFRLLSNTDSETFRENRRAFEKAERERRYR